MSSDKRSSQGVLKRDLLGFALLGHVDDDVVITFAGMTDSEKVLPLHA